MTAKFRSASEVTQPMRRWLFCRIRELNGTGIAPALELAGAAIERAREGDADSCSFFDRAPAALELWCHTTAAMSRQVAGLLHAQAAAARLPLTVGTGRRP